MIYIVILFIICIAIWVAVILNSKNIQEDKINKQVIRSEKLKTPKFINYNESSKENHNRIIYDKTGLSASDPKLAKLGKPKRNRIYKNNIEREKEFLTRWDRLVDMNDEEFADDLKQAKQKMNQWSTEFNKVADIMKLAKETEKNDIYKSISLYESILNSKYGNFAPEYRLIILYHKIGNYEEEIKMSKMIISRIKKSNNERLVNAIKADPMKEKEIRNAWADFKWFTGSDGRQKKCSKDYSKYEKRIDKAYQLIKQNKI